MIRDKFRLAGLSLAASTLLAFAHLSVSAEPPKNALESRRAEEFFEAKVRPILVKRCYECHAGDTEEGGLRVDSRSRLLAGADGRRVVIPGKPDESPFVVAIRRQNDVQMPPDEPLPKEEMETLVRWVRLGAPWGKNAPADNEVLTREQRFEQQRLSHWAYQPVRRPPRPKVESSDWVRTPIDALVLAELQSEGLQPSPEAERRTLIRRATYDLLGVPPTPEQVAAFEDDDRPNAYERLVDRLLASPRYGERWGRHWLDLARYADTKGYSFGRERRYPYSYTYRDYVIQAWNKDLPYDQFLLQQLAADLLSLEPNAPELAALGFLTVGRKFNNRHDDLDDQIDVVSRGLLGLTVSCARCHDHKYDAIPTQDYYSLYGVFASSVEPSDLPIIGEPSDKQAYAKYLAERKKLQAAVDAFHHKTLAALLDAARGQNTEYLTRVVSRLADEALVKLPYVKLRRDQLRAPLIRRWQQYLAKRTTADHPLWSPLHAVAGLDESAFSAEAPARLRGLLELPTGVLAGQLNPQLHQALSERMPTTRAELARVYGELLNAANAAWKKAGRDAAALDAPTRQLAGVLSEPGGPTDVGFESVTQYLNRAERNKSRELQKKLDQLSVHSPGAPPRAMVVRENSQPHNPRVFIRGNHARPGDPVPRQSLYVLAGPTRKPFVDGGGRLELAEAIIDPANPLTPRVLVNRVWMHHFGEPLVETPSDFGVRTPQPRHHALLDYLAWSFLKNNWSLKSLHRQIMLSNVYRQQSRNRPNAAQRDPENRLYWRMNRRRLEFEPLRDSLLAAAGTLDASMRGRGVNLFAKPFARRRAVYGLVDRQDLPNLFRVFDFASPDQSNARRPRTTVPQQALFLMNSPFVAEQAAAVLQRSDVRQRTQTVERIQRLYAVLLSRLPSQAEVRVGREFLADANNEAPEAAWVSYVQLLMLSNEFVFVD